MRVRLAASVIFPNMPQATGTVTESTRKHSFVEWDNGYSEWYDSDTLIPA